MVSWCSDISQYSEQRHLAAIVILLIYFIFDRFIIFRIFPDFQEFPDISIFPDSQEFPEFSIFPEIQQIIQKRKYRCQFFYYQFIHGQNFHH
jgi:hypothetical protein